MPPGMPSPVLDEGHTGMMLADFCSHPVAVGAGLSRVQVLALRLFTTGMHLSINKPLRGGCSPQQPHPYPALVVHLRNVSGPEIPFGLLALLNAIMAGALQWATGDGTKWLHAKVGGTERVSINASSRAVGLAATVDEGLGALRETATVS